MKGWMTKAAGLMLILYGMIGWAAGIHDYDTALTSVANGLGFIGLRRATDKAVDTMVTATHSQTTTINEIVRKHQRS